MKKPRKSPAPSWFVATYGNMGLEVEFFTNKREYERATRKAERDHDQDRLDSYTNGDVRK